MIQVKPELQVQNFSVWPYQEALRIIFPCLSKIYNNTFPKTNFANHYDSTGFLMSVYHIVSRIVGVQNSCRANEKYTAYQSKMVATTAQCTESTYRAERDSVL